MKIIYLPLENIEQRYTVMMNDSIAPYVDKYLYPDFKYPTKIENGQFLDINKTILFKAKQLQMVAEMFLKKEIKDGDVFLVADIFYPGIESIRYMAELQDIEIYIYGFNYAGRSDKNDFVQKLSSWADKSELSYHLTCDGTFVGSKYHKQNIQRYFPEYQGDILVTGYIWSRKFVNNVYKEKLPKKDFVIWPHRICKEKGFDEFLEIAKNNPSQRYIITSSGNKKDVQLPENVEYFANLSKKQYYQYLSRADKYLSTAHQETFGYTLQEAIHFNCKIAVPNRACYPEMVPERNLYDNIKNISYHPVNHSWTEKWNNNIEQIIKYIHEDINSRK